MVHGPTSNFELRTVNLLEMRAAGATLRGHWLHDGLPLGPGLKLIRAGQSGLA
jgi:hypothetical protein